MLTNQVIIGDFLEVTHNWEDKCVDMILTSPPFKDEDVIADYWITYKAWYNEMIRLSAKVVCVIHTSTKLNYLMSNYPPKRLMIWGKGFSQYSYRFNPILVYQIDDTYKINRYIWSDVFGVQSVIGKNKLHKYQDPLTLYIELIKMFKGCISIFDPFAGSGTTLCAAKTLGRNYIGIELSADYVNKIILPRLAATPVL
jgi:DNA modification methylase